MADRINQTAADAEIIRDDEGSKYIAWLYNPRTARLVAYDKAGVRWILIRKLLYVHCFDKDMARASTMESKFETAEITVMRLREALKPLARIAIMIDSKPSGLLRPDDAILRHAPNDVLTVGHARAARLALEATDPAASLCSSTKYSAWDRTDDVKEEPALTAVTDEMLAAGAEAFVEAFDAGTSGGGLPSIYRAMASKDVARNQQKLALEGLANLVYEVTHLSPQNEDGSHNCRISAEALRLAREALQTQ